MQVFKLSNVSNFNFKFINKMDVESQVKKVLACEFRGPSYNTANFVFQLFHLTISSTSILSLLQKIYVLYISRLEADVKRLKADLQSSRNTETDLRSQLNSKSTEDRQRKATLAQLQQDNESLQNKYVITNRCRL